MLKAGHALVVAVLAVGCATGYGPSGFGGGYSEVQLNDRTFQVRFSGNGWTSASEAQSGAMRRAAELTEHYGFYGFTVHGQNTNMRTSVYTPPTSCSTIGTTTVCNGGDPQVTEKPDSVMTITMVTLDEAQHMDPAVVVYDARMILAQQQF